MYSRFMLGLLAAGFVFSTSNITRAKDVPSPVALLMKHKLKTATSARRSVNNDRTMKELHLSLTKAQCQDVEKSLTEAYGPATKSRGKIRIWEIENLHNSGEQSKIVTIVAGEADGRYFAKLDRKGSPASNNPRLRKRRSLKNTQSQFKSANTTFERD